MIDTIVFYLGGILIPEKWDEIVRAQSSFLGMSQEEFVSAVAERRPKLVTGEISLRAMYENMLSDGPAALKALTNHLRLYLEHSTERDTKIEGLISLLSKTYKVDCATNTEIEIATLNEQLGLFDYFSQAFKSTRLRTSKKDQEFYRLMLAYMGKKSQQVLFIDNDIRYLEPAQKIGLHTILYGAYKTGFPKLLEDLCSFGIRL